MIDRAVISWSGARLGEAVEALARTSGLSPRSIEPTSSSLSLDGVDGVSRAVEALSRALAVETDPVSIRCGDIDAFLRGAAPAILRVPCMETPEFLALARSGTNRLAFLAPDGEDHFASLRDAREILCGHLEAPLLTDVERLVNEARIEEPRRDRARAAILRERIADEVASEAWLLRSAPGAGLARQLRASGLAGTAAVLVGIHVLQFSLWLLSWWMLGKGALQGRLDPGWLLAWGLLLLTIIPVRLLTLWLQGTLAIGSGAILKQRLLYGAMRLAPEEIRGQGVGQLLGRVLESEAVESLALTGGVMGLLASIELVFAVFVLLAGVVGSAHIGLLVLWMGLTFLVGWWYSRRRLSWTRLRIDLTNDLVERMVGHRTRLAQLRPAHWHDGEDQAIERYVHAGSKMDRIAALLLAALPRGWLLVGILGLVPVITVGEFEPARLAISLGGILLAYRGLEKLSWGLWHLVDARIAWFQATPISDAASRPELLGAPYFAGAPPGSAEHADPDQPPVLEATDLVFRYRDRGEPVLRGCSLTLRRGDRVLLRGVSGGGKSTLTSILTGLRSAESGLLLSRGLDRQTLGSRGWCRRIVSAPQFHENHVVNDTFAFNLLMGRRWPPSIDDLTGAEALCRELGLGSLLNQMPAGMLQVVGESGWQLSHGERSRLFLARALLQGSEVVILDESFAALDPENLRQCIETVRRRAPTLLLIAHP